LNVVVGLFVPSALLGVAAPSLVGNLTAFWYVAMTVLVLVLAYAKGRIDRRSGWLIVSSYMAFVVCVVLAA
jgi:hypothetical protein